MISDVPKTWGESDSALFPKELQRLLEGMSHSFTVERIDSKGRTKRYTTNIALLSNKFKWRSLLTSADLLTKIRDLTPQFLSEQHERWLDFPILPDLHNGETCEISRLALLRSTHAVLRRRGIEARELNVHLQYGSFLTILKLTDDLVSSLDLLMTARDHVAPASFHQRPATLNESLVLGIQCILLGHGLTRDSDILDSLQTIIGLRMGLHEDGAQTLQSISETVGVTR